MRCLDQHKIAWAHDKWNCGYTYQDIAEALNVSYKTIKRCIEDMYGKANKKRNRPKLVYEPPIVETEVPEPVEFPEDF